MRYFHIKLLVVITLNLAMLMGVAVVLYSGNSTHNGLQQRAVLHSIENNRIAELLQLLTQLQQQFLSSHQAHEVSAKELVALHSQIGRSINRLQASETTQQHLTAPLLEWSQEIIHNYLDAYTSAPLSPPSDELYSQLHQQLSRLNRTLADASATPMQGNELASLTHLIDYAQILLEHYHQQRVPSNQRILTTLEVALQQLNPEQLQQHSSAPPSPLIVIQQQLYHQLLTLKDSLSSPQSDAAPPLRQGTLHHLIVSQQQLMQLTQRMETIYLQQLTAQNVRFLTATTTNLERMGWVSTIAILLSIGTALLFSRLIHRPYTQLLQGVQRFTQGDHSFRFDAPRDDPFNPVFNAFDDLAAGLTYSDRTLTHNLNELSQLNARLQQQAYFDDLTQLPNRRMALERINHELSRALRHRRYGALLFLDMDRFKLVNDTLGHPVGDSLLQQVAQRLTLQLRSSDTAARIGGDEFVVLITDVDADKQKAANHIRQLAEKLRDTLTEPYQIGDHLIHSSPSIGIAMFPFEVQNGEGLLKHADIAMYRSKEGGRNMIHFFQPSMQQLTDQRTTMEQDIRHALAHHEFVLYYQPQVDRDGHLFGVEALIRWHHPHKGWIAPDAFIPIAEETGQILELGRWVLESACQQLASWQQQGLDIRVAVNISPMQFHMEGFQQQVEMQIQQTGIDPRQLELEVTEGVMMTRMESAIEKMNRLKQLGVKISMDDFGTGFSSLTYLKLLPLDTLKIDQSFIHGISTSAMDAAIVETIISMAALFTFEVIAEGVESKAELAFLTQRGCLEYQGYYFSKALPASEISAEMISLGLPLPTRKSGA